MRDSLGGRLKTITNEILYRFSPFILFGDTQQSSRQGSPERSRRSENETNQLLNARIQPIEEIIRSSSKVYTNAGACRSILNRFVVSVSHLLKKIRLIGYLRKCLPYES